MTFPELETARLKMRAVTQTDFDRIRHLFADKDVARMTASFPHPISDEWAQQFIDRTIANDLKNDVVWALDDGSGFVGCLGAHDLTKEAGFGYTLGKPYWNRGYMSEALQAALTYLAEERQIPHVSAGVFLDNPASARVLEKNGFQKTHRGERGCVARKQTALAVQYFGVALDAKGDEPA